MTLVDANPDGPHPLPGVVTHVVTVPELGLVYTSGQVAWDKDGNLGPLHAGTRRCAASSLVGIQPLFAPGYLIEIEAVARIPVA